jgi:ankyrin repeat protein
LTANRLADPIRDISRYHIRLNAAHTILAQACLGVLLRLDDRVDRDNIENFPLARYAARYWDTHARFENASSRIKDGLECLFDADKPHFATWLWIYNQDWPNRSMFTKRPETPEAVPLYYAARLGFCDLAGHLIAEHPEQVNARGGNEETPMHAAAFAGHADILSLLLEHGAPVDVQGRSGLTPLHRATSNGKVEAGQHLLDRGANINAPRGYGRTPLSWAITRGHVEFARMLLKRGARIDDADNGGRTALHWAVIKEDIQAARLLLEHSADINAPDEYGMTPARYSRQQEFIQLLTEYGAKSV